MKKSRAISIHKKYLENIFSQNKSDIAKARLINKDGLYNSHITWKGISVTCYHVKGLPS